MSRMTSWPGTSSTVTAEVHGAVVVVVDPLDRRRRPADEVVLRRRVGGRPQHDRVAAPVGDPVHLGRRPRPRAGRHRHPPVQVHQLLRRRPRRALEHLPHRRVLRGRRLALLVREREHVDQQRLLDLGRVEQAALALGRDLRVVGEHDRGAEHRVVLRRGEHRPRVDLLAARRPRAARRSGPPATRPTTCVESSECRSASPRSSPSGTSVWFSTADRHAAAVRSASEARARAGRRSRTSTVPGAAAGRSGGRSPWWRTPLACRKCTSPREPWQPASQALDLQHGRTSPRCPPRRRAGRRSRTASASRSSSRPACTGRARSPRTAACRRARQASSSSSATQASNDGSPADALRSCSRSSVEVCSRTQPPPG